MKDLELVLEEARFRGLIGSEPVSRTLDHARRLGRVFSNHSGPILDLGTGGGVPGLILAMEWPESEWLLLDSNHRATDFLAQVIQELGCNDRVQVACERAEIAGHSPGHRGHYPVVMARSVAPPAVVAEYAAPFLAPEGILVVSEPPDGNPDRWREDGLLQLGMAIVELVTEPVRAAVIQMVGECPVRYPRRTGVAAKRPLW